MSTTKLRNSLLALLFLSTLGTNAQNGLATYLNQSFLIPMYEEGGIMKGHAYVHLLDKVSKDTNSIIIEMYYSYLHDVGEKKFNISSKYKFESAIYNGKNFVTKFVNDGDNERYLIFNTNAEKIADIKIDSKYTSNDKQQLEAQYNQTPLVALSNNDILDYCTETEHKKEIMCTRCISNSAVRWKTSSEKASDIVKIVYLTSNKEYIVNALYTKDKFITSNVHSYIQLLSIASGKEIALYDLYKSNEITNYPISATLLANNTIQVISQFTKQPHKFSTLKYGISSFTLNMASKIDKEVYNEWTETMQADSIFKKNKLLQNSFLMVHKAVKLKNGNWLLAYEHIYKFNYFNFMELMYPMYLKQQPYFFKKKNIGVMEVDKDANIIYHYVVNNKENLGTTPESSKRKPYRVAQEYVAAQATDIKYAVQSDSKIDEMVSFVYTDVSRTSNKKTLGNILYKNGVVTVDNFTIPTQNDYSQILVLPARYGHTMLFKYDPFQGKLDFDFIKFNN